MELDEAIKHCRDKAEELRKEDNWDFRNTFTKDWGECIECAKEHEQLADWLEELKAFRAAKEEIAKLPVVWEEGAGITECYNILEKHLRRFQ